MSNYTLAPNKLNMYIIYLERLPDRLQLFYEKNKGIVDKVNMIPIKGVDGEEFIKNYDIKHLQPTNGQLGCFLSHQNVWRIIANSKNNDVSFIVEDDAIIDVNLFRDLPKIFNTIDKYDSGNTLNETYKPDIGTIDVISSSKYTVTKDPMATPTYFPLYKPIIVMLSRSSSRDKNIYIDTISSYNDEIVVELITSRFTCTHFYILNKEGAKVLLNNNFDAYGSTAVDAIMSDSKNIYGILLNKDLMGYSGLVPRDTTTGMTYIQHVDKYKSIIRNFFF